MYLPSIAFIGNVRGNEFFVLSWDGMLTIFFLGGMKGKTQRGCHRNPLHSGYEGENLGWLRS